MTLEETAKYLKIGKSTLYKMAREGKMVEPDEGYIDHPTPKPKHFIKELLKMFTKEGELILDPFVGSGSVSLACYQMNRNFIAFEIKKEYCLLAYQRLENSFKLQLKWQGTLWSK